MARAPVLSFVLAVLASNASVAAPALELSGRDAAEVANAPVTAPAFLQRSRQLAAAAAGPAASAASGQVPRTPHDNSAYRFNMTQNGRRMTAEEFAAWMKARGIRVATGKPAGGEAPAAAPAAGTAQACQPTATTAC